MNICIVSHNAYGALSGARTGHIGGVEWQTYLMASWFVEQGHRVSVLTWKEGADGDELISGIRVLKICDSEEGISRIRFFVPRWSGLVSALGRAEADVYYHCGAEAFTGQIALWCRIHGRRFVFSVASDADCEARSIFFTSRFEWAFYKFGLKHANAVICQSRQQALKLQKNFGLEATVIPMPGSGDGAGNSMKEIPISVRVLWVGRICDVKRPDRLLEVARLSPGVEFDLVGPHGDDEYSQMIVREAASIPNVKLHGRKSKEDMDSVYHDAGMLCCTSDMEGFPNTFLEAWSQGRPVVTTFDPDGIVTRYGLGGTASDAAGLTALIAEILPDRSRLEMLGSNAREYYLQNHSPEVVYPKFEAVFSGEFVLTPLRRTDNLARS